MQHERVGVAAVAKRLKLTRPIIPEGQLAKSVAALLDTVVLEPAIWTHFPAGLGKLPPATVGRAKAMGLKAGMPDYFVWHGGRSVGIELKRENGILSDVQKAMHLKLLAAGVPVYVCRTPEQVIEWLHIEGVPMRKNFVDAILREKRKWQDPRQRSDARHGETFVEPAPGGGDNG